MLKDITLGQFFPADTPVHRLDPRTKLLCVILYIVALFNAKGPLTYGIMIVVLAVCILLSLLALGVKNIYLGPTLPAFLSETVVKTLVDAYGLQPITDPQQDLDAIFHRG